MMTNKKQIQECVAKEFGYQSEVIEEVLFQHSFDCSGDVVDYLFQLNDQEITNLQRSHCLRVEHEALEKQREEEETRDAKLKILRHETETLYLNSICWNCFKNPRNILTLPCGHLCLCVRCSERVDKCPICEKEIRQTVKTYLS